MSRHAAKRPRHRVARREKPRLMLRDHTTRRFICLWSVNGDPIARFEAWAADGLKVAHVVFDGVRYDWVERQSDHAKIVHYQTRTIILKAAA